MKPKNSPLERYQREIESGKLHPDSAQHNAILQLDSLFHQVVSYPHPGNWIQRVLNWSDGTVCGFYLWGGVGTGKTLLMDIFYNSLPNGIAQRIHFHRFMQWVHEQKNKIKDRRDPLGIVAKSFSNKSGILCLDEFSVTDITDAMILSGLLDHLFSAGVVLVTTSNTEIDNLYLNGLQRDRFLPAIDLLKKHTTGIHIDSGNDYRMAYLREDAIFHTPLGEKAYLELSHCFDQLAGSYDPDNKAISISGRNIEVVALASGVVWFEFTSLCRTNRSKTDYIEIAKQFHTVLISDIPQLDATLDDAARRFIELIDEFYDRNVNLIVSSAQPPENIYSGKRLANPFKRTVSRLREMSSFEYLAKPHLS